MNQHVATLDLNGAVENLITATQQDDTIGAMRALIEATRILGRPDSDITIAIDEDDIRISNGDFGFGLCVKVGVEHLYSLGG